MLIPFICCRNSVSLDGLARSCKTERRKGGGSVRASNVSGHGIEGIESKRVRVCLGTVGRRSIRISRYIHFLWPSAGELFRDSSPQLPVGEPAQHRSCYGKNCPPACAMSRKSRQYSWPHLSSPQSSYSTSQNDYPKTALHAVEDGTEWKWNDKFCTACLRTSVTEV